MQPTRPIRLSLYWLWTAGILTLLALHAVHLRADFPNNSPWMDYSKYTDEGWYGKAAIEHYVLGSWYVHGDFNPGVALPILPLLEAAVFHFTGVSLVAARLLVLGVFAATLLLSYFVMRTQAPNWNALFAVTLLAANAFLYAFSRLAILELLLTFFLLLAWLLALHLPRLSGAWRSLALAAIGLLLCLMVLSKTTAIFLLPSAFFLIWHAYGYKWREALPASAIAALAAALPWSAYYFLFVRHYVADYHYLFAANVWEQPTTFLGWIATFWYAIHGASWIDPRLCVLAVALFVLSAIFCRTLWRNPLLIASLLAAAGYIFFTGWHNNMQPRYYQVVAYPLVFIVALALHALFSSERRRLRIVDRTTMEVPRVEATRRSKLAFLARPAAFVALTLLLFSTFINVREIVYWTRHPEYSWINAARQVTRYIDQHPNGNRLLLSISGDNITLITHLPAICDDFGTWDLPLRIHRYRPGWYAAWNEIDPGSLEDLHTQYSLEQVAIFHAFDDPDRNQLVLYKLHPLPIARQHYNQAIEERANAGK